MSEGQKTRRRWFRFSLRTLFVVVTLVAVSSSWVVYQLNWIRGRRELAERQVARIAELAPEIVGVVIYANPPPETPAAIKLLSLLGERPRQGVMLIFWGDTEADLSEAEKRELESARRLFPESQIMWKRAEKP